MADTSSLISSASGTERYDTDEEVCSFDLVPEPYDPEVQGRLPSDEWMDDYQQGLVPYEEYVHGVGTQVLVCPRHTP